jgi:hypothetical protein
MLRLVLYFGGFAVNQDRVQISLVAESSCGIFVLCFLATNAPSAMEISHQSSTPIRFVPFDAGNADSSLRAVNRL